MTQTQFPDPTDYYIPRYFPSSILPSLSGIGVVINNPYISGYPDIGTKIGLLQSGTGLFTGNFADYHQDRDFNNINNLDLGNNLNSFRGNGINKKYVSPTSYRYGNNIDGTLYGVSGIYITYPPHQKSPEWSSYDGSTGTGIFSFSGFLSGPSPKTGLKTFSNAKESKERAGASGIDNFKIFNPYIHHDGSSSPSPVLVPYLSDLVATKNRWDRYGRLLLNLEP